MTRPPCLGGFAPNARTGPTGDSSAAAIQAPVIIMSQTRQEARDRLRSENDYRVNLKAELEIRLLHEKLDFLLEHQWRSLLEIQQIQVDLMNEMGERR